MILHTVNKSPATHSALRDCVTAVLAGDAVILLEDGVYGAVQQAESAQLLQTLKEHKIALYAVKDDVLTRGISGKLSSSVHLVSYDEFVDLTVHHQSVQSWY